MIGACETQEFAPFGREYIRLHPGQFQLQVQKNLHRDHGLPLFKYFREILSMQDYEKKEQWTFTSHGDKKESFDEELYISGNTVIWSRGGTDSRTVVKTFTVDTPVVHALWVDFVLPERDKPRHIQPTLNAAGTIEHGICVVEARNLRFFKDKGGEHVANVPFQVTNASVIKNGILFERSVTHSELASPKKYAPNQTVVFSLLHPLDEVAPVIIKTQNGSHPPRVRYLTDNSMQIIFTSCEPSLALTYDRMYGLHSLWRVRRATSEECYTVSSQWDSSFNNNNQPSMTPMMNPNLSSGSHSRLMMANLSLHSPGISPYQGFMGKKASPLGVSRSGSPSTSLMAGLSRSSPGLAGLLHRLYSPSALKRSPGALLRTACSSQNSSLAGNESFSVWVEPLQPEVCLEHIWTETAPPIRDGSLGKASKAFITADFCGQRYLCFMVPYRQQLRCIKFEESNDLSQLIFGTQTVIPAKDATPVEALSLLVVLESSGFLVVYSGITKINHLHVPLMPPLGASGSMSMLRAMTPINSPSCNIFTSSRPPSAMDVRFDEEMNHISPVQTTFDDSSHFENSVGESSMRGNPSIQSLGDNAGNRFTIELVSGHMFRTSMPPLTNSPGIGLCLKALKHLLPKDVAMGILGRWYTKRNTPGGLGKQTEWSAFTVCLLSAMGYDTSKLALTRKQEADLELSPVLSAKRAKPSDQGSEEDWEFLLASSHHQYRVENCRGVEGLTPCVPIADSSTYSRPCSLDTSAPLFLYCPPVMLALHLAYEELKLNILLHEELDQLIPMLFQVARDLKCTSYLDYYCRDFPHLFTVTDDVSQVTEEHLTKMQYPSAFPTQVPSVSRWVYQKLQGKSIPPMVYIPNCTTDIKNIITLYSLLLYPDLASEQAVDKCLRKISPSGHRAPTADISLSRSFQVSPVPGAGAERIVLCMTELGMMEETLERLPVGVALPLREAIFLCRCSPPSDWPEAAFTLIGREDLARLKSMQGSRPSSTPSVFNCQPQAHSKTSRDEDDGMEMLDDQVLRLRFSEDLRVQEARRLLQSSKPVRIALIQRPEVSDHDFIEEQERHLYSLCIRTMALPVGRGIISLCTCHPVPTEALPIPKLCLTGKAPPRNTTVDLTHIDTPSNMAAWPHFHNGVAAGLRVAHSSQVESTWIIFNKPKSNELTNEFAGFLMALGLNGHLGNLHTLSVHDYLSKGHEMTTVGLILGLGANYRGTMDLATTRLLSIHVAALLPPTSTELNIPHNVQVAAVLGVGLLYQGTGHLHMAEVLLSEIGRPPGPEMENSTDRESYSLAAGLALGLVMFGKGKDAVGLSDHSMADILCHFMVGGHKRPLPIQYRERYKTPSYLFWEGDCVNVDVTAPGATLALGMLFFNTGNTAIAEWLKAPDTQFMLDQVRPDFLLLRTLSRGLVMWDSIQPSMEWVRSNLPEIVKKFAFKKGEGEEPEGDDVVDFETMSQAYCNIVVGSCMALGLKFAGTANQQAFTTLMDCLNRSLQIVSLPSLCEQAGRSTVENCMPVIVVALAMVMAGTGNLEVLRMCRMLRKRVGPQYSSVVYGSHMAISIAIGLLFMGAGRYTLGTKPQDIGVLLCAFFPKYPHHSNDNRYHLQAFRHLYVLAAEPRVVIPRDVDTGVICYVPLQVKFKNCTDYKDVSYKCFAPCILPELDRLEEIRVLGPRYWPIVFKVDKNWDILQHLLKNSSSLFVKQRAGQLSYLEDPQGYRSMLAKSLTADHSGHYLDKPDVITSFTSDPRIIALAEVFLKSKSEQETMAIQDLSAVLYECITMEKPEAISSHFVLEQLLRQAKSGLPCSGLWQLKLMLAYYNSPSRLHPSPEESTPATVIPTPSTTPSSIPTTSTPTLMDVEFLLSLKHHLENAMDRWLQGNVPLLVTYLSQKPVPREALLGEERCLLSQYLAWYDIPLPQHLASVNVKGAPTLPVLCQQLPDLSVTTVMRILRAWQAAR